MSKQDIKKGIKLPTKLTKELAEFVGIMVGDGHLSFYPIIDKKGSKRTISDVKISGNKKEEHYLKYVMKTFCSLFKTKMKYAEDTNPNAIVLRAHSKGIVRFINEICEIPLNRKSNNTKIPKMIKNSNNQIKYSFLRGLADTDFSLIFQNKTGKGYNYPLIKASFKSKALVKDLEDMFFKLGLKCSTYYDEIRKDNRFGPVIMHNVYLYGRANLRKWVSLIGFSNSKFQGKLKKWQEDGVCPPGY